MLNLKDLTFSYSNSDWQDTFVGIKKNHTTGRFEFQLPKGFKDFPSGKFEAVKTLFFRTYKTYRKFFEDKKRLSEENQLDGFSELENGYSIEGKNGEIISYSKLNMLDAILDAYNELSILTVKNKLSKSTEINYSQIHKYLHKAIFVDEDTVFIDEMDFPKKVIEHDSPTIIEMFCFIYTEVKSALEERIESDRAKSLSTEFREKHLTNESSLFDEDTFIETTTVLKDLLDEIDRTTAYKDADYWHFHDAVYKFLYGENEHPDNEAGNIWGISNFAILWEELCFNEARKRLSETQLLFADRLGNSQIYNSFESPFYLQLNSLSQKRRKLRPDLVYSNFNGTIDLEHLKRIYDIQEIRISDHVNVKLVPKLKNHTFYQIDEIYQKYLNKNYRYTQNPKDERFANVASMHREDFFNDVNNYFSKCRLNELMLKRPCIFNFTIIDYKYITEESCCSVLLSAERRLDVKKQLVYEFALQLNYYGAWTLSQFWIPYYFEDADKDFIEVLHPNKLFTESKIAVFKRNFLKLQDIYIKEND